MINNQCVPTQNQSAPTQDAPPCKTVLYQGDETPYDKKTWCPYTGHPKLRRVGRETIRTENVQVPMSVKTSPETDCNHGRRGREPTVPLVFGGDDPSVVSPNIRVGPP